MADQKLPPPCASPKTELPSRTRPAKRAAIYTRVSCGDQHPETQLYDIRDLAKQRRFEIVREYSDIISGAKSKRPGLDQLLRMPAGTVSTLCSLLRSTELQETSAIF